MTVLTTSVVFRCFSRRIRHLVALF